MRLYTHQIQQYSLDTIAKKDGSVEIIKFSLELCY